MFEDYSIINKSINKHIVLIFNRFNSIYWLVNRPNKFFIKIALKNLKLKQNRSNIIFNGKNLIRIGI